MSTDDSDTPVSPRPFPGARPFRETEDLLFFGRGLPIAVLLEAVRSNRVTVLHGHTGVGKTSLLRAGLLPRLGHDAALGQPLAGRAYPEAALPGHDRVETALLRTLSPGERPSALARAGLREWASRFAAERDRPVIVVDQAEDLFAHASPAQRAAVLGALAEIEPHVLLAVREEYLADLLAELPGPALVRLDELPAGELAACLAGPPHALGLPGGLGGLAEGLLAVRHVSEDGTRTGERAEAVHPWVLQQAAAGEWPDGDLSRTSVDRLLTDALWRAVCLTAKVHDLDPAILATRLARELVSSAGHAASLWPQGGILSENLLRTLQNTQILTRARDGFRLVSDRLLEPLRRLAAQAPLRDVPAFPPGVLLAEARQAPLHQAFRLVTGISTTDTVVARDAHILLGDLHHRRGDGVRAERHYRVAAAMAEITGNPSLVGALLTALGHLRRLGGDPTAALGILQSASLRLPGDHTIRSELAAAFADSGDHRTAAALDHR